MSKSRYEKSIDARGEAVYRFVKFMTNKSAVDADLDGVKCNRLTEHAIEYRENVKGAPDRVWEQPVIPFWDAYRAMTDGKYSYLFRELGDLSTEPLTHEVDTATDVVEVIENAMQVFQDHINRKWKEH